VIHRAAIELKNVLTGAYPSNRKWTFFPTEIGQWVGGMRIAGDKSDPTKRETPSLENPETGDAQNTDHCLGEQTRIHLQEPTGPGLTIIDLQRLRQGLERIPSAGELERVQTPREDCLGEAEEWATVGTGGNKKEPPA
jgi:hypothetical protein